MNVFQTFMRWWNTLAQENGKLKFRTQREAADFIRRIHNENGGPNDKIRGMRERYNEIRRIRESNAA